MTTELTARVRDRLVGLAVDADLEDRVSVLLREEAPLLTPEAHAHAVA
ncbi:MAG: hypothetical protein JO148_06475, partial [Acidimicrobiia bacterium]|nr:hypothetical protein [Acidimicrobiia bacterium]